MSVAEQEQFNVFLFPPVVIMGMMGPYAATPSPTLCLGTRNDGENRFVLMKGKRAVGVGVRTG